MQHIHIYIYRNPLDILLSYLNYTRIEYKFHLENVAYQRELFIKVLGFSEPYSYSSWLEMGIDNIAQENLDHALDFFSDNDLTITAFSRLSGSWLQHTKSWIDASRSMEGTSIRYEDCLASPEHIAQLAYFFTFS